MTERPEPRFRRRFRGYDIEQVNEEMSTLEQRIEVLLSDNDSLDSQLGELREQHNEREAALARSRAELRYWNDRASYVDAEVTRARKTAEEIEAAARERAEGIEASAQERSLAMIERVCDEANAMLRAAREEAREMFMRFEIDVDLSQQKLHQLEQVRHDVAAAMQNALGQFEEAVTELNSVSPIKQIVEQLDEPTRRTSAPTFGRQEAIAAAEAFEKRFDGTLEELEIGSVLEPMPEWNGDATEAFSQN